MNSIAEIKSAIVDELEKLSLRIAANIDSTGQTASGKTAKSLKVSETESGAKLEGRKPFGALETGRKAGKTPKGFTAIIRQWVKDKGINAAPIPYIRQTSDKWQPKYTPQERGNMSLASTIAWSIREHGTKLHRDGGRDDVYSNEIPKTIQAVSERASKIFVTRVVEQIKLNTK